MTLYRLMWLVGTVGSLFISFLFGELRASFDSLVLGFLAYLGSIVFFVIAIICIFNYEVKK